MTRGLGRARRGWAPYIVLVTALALTALATMLTAESVAARDRARFENAVASTRDSIRDRLEIYLSLLRGGAGLFVASDEVTIDEFHDYVAQLDIAELYPGIQGIGFTRRIAPADVSSMVAGMRQVYPDFRIWPEHERDEYHAIIYLEPQDARNRAAVGYDMSTEPTRRDAMARARDSGQAAASGRVTLVQEITPGDVQAGFLIYYPIYGDGVVPATLDERRERLVGFVYAPFRAGDLLRGIFGTEEHPRVHLRIYDGQTTRDEHLMYWTDDAMTTAPDAQAPRYVTTMPVEVAGRVWTLAIRSRQDDEALSSSNIVWTLAIGGTVLSLALFLVARSLSIARASAEQRLIDLRASERALRESENRFRLLFQQSPITIQIFAADGTTLDVNEAWCELWQTQREQVRGYNVLSDAQLARMGVLPVLRRAFAGEHVSMPAVRYDPAEIGKVGRPRWVEMFAYPIRDDQGGAVREVILMLEDVTERRAAEEAVRRSEQRYRSLVDATAQIVWTTSAEGDVVEDLPSWRRFTGQAVDEIMGRGWASAVHPDDVERVGQTWAQSLANKSPHEQEFRVRRIDGAWSDVLARAVPVVEPDGTLREWVGTCTDITDQERDRQALEASERRFRYMFDSNIVGVAFWRFDGTIHQANDYLLNLLGFTRDEMERGLLNWRRQTPEEFNHVDDRAVGQLERSGVTEPFEKELYTPTGHRVAVLAVAALVPGSLAEGMSFVIDVTQRRRAEEELKRAVAIAEAARQEAEAANRLKDEFLATVSHELRTPLNAMLGWTQLLMSNKHPDPAELRHALSIIDRNTRAQAQLVEDLLDVSRIISGRLRLEMARVDPVPIVRATVESVRPGADAKRIALNMDVGEDVGPIHADPQRLQQIVWNLLSNAVKFTPAEGQIDVTLSREGGDVVIRVADTGIGISPAFLPHVFERFRQADASTTRAHGGLGLGLGIVRHLTELHGGTVSVESAGEGRGATLTVRLPVPAVAVDVQSAATDNGEQPQPAIVRTDVLRGVSVLVVDDNVDAVHLVARVLRVSGAEVAVSNSAGDALELFFQNRPNVLVSDIAMPGHDGYWLIQRIRAAEQSGAWPPTPTIALTAYARAEDQRKTREAGFDDHIAKPVDPTILIDTIARLADQSRRALSPTPRDGQEPG